MVGDYVMKDGSLYLIEDESELSKYTLFDVIIPIIGSETVFNPKSIAHEAYKVLLEKEKLSLADFDNHCDRFINKLRLVRQRQKNDPAPRESPIQNWKVCQLE